MKVKIKIEDSVGTSLQNWIEETMPASGETDPVGTAIIGKMRASQDWTITLTGREEVSYLQEQISARADEVDEIMGQYDTYMEEWTPYNLERHRLRRSAQRLKRLLREEG